MTKILVVDDDPAIRDLLCKALERDGFTVDQAEDGDEGCRKFDQSPADLVVLDIMMPNKEGLETIMSLKKTDPAVKIIAMSGGGHSGMMDALPIAKKLGALVTLPKPIEITELLELVHDYVD